MRRRLRSHGRSLGDARRADGRQDCQRLEWEIAYEHWHRMLFARFLADNNLLMYDGVAVTLEECDELAEDEGAKSGWELAGRLAARMLPQVFKPKSPVFELTFAPEDQAKLTRLLADLSDDVFKASDSLGWVYQFWQAQRKEDINKSEVKIGADELPAVTQLFTEPYMVEFLLHNSLGAWWVTRHPETPCPVELTYRLGFEEVMSTQRAMSTAASALVAELGDDFDDKSGALLAQAVTTLATRATFGQLEKDSVEIGDVLDLARAAKAAQESRSLNLKERKAVAQLAREKLLEEQKAKLDAMGNKGGVTEETKRAIREVLGIV